MHNVCVFMIVWYCKQNFCSEKLEMFGLYIGKHLRIFSVELVNLLKRQIWKSKTELNSSLSKLRLLKAKKLSSQLSWKHSRKKPKIVSLKFLVNGVFLIPLRLKTGTWAEPGRGPPHLCLWPGSFRECTLPVLMTDHMSLPVFPHVWKVT